MSALAVGTAKPVPSSMAAAAMTIRCMFSLLEFFISLHAQGNLATCTYHFWQVDRHDFCQKSNSMFVVTLILFPLHSAFSFHSHDRTIFMVRINIPGLRVSP